MGACRFGARRAAGPFHLARRKGGTGIVYAGELLERRVSGTTLMNRGLLVAAREEFSRWLSLVEEIGDGAQMVPALNALAAVAKKRGDMDGALGHLDRALALTCEPGADPADKLRVHLNRMGVHTESGSLDEALAAAREAESLVPDRDPLLGQAYWLNLSMLYWRRHEWVPMRQAAKRACERSLKTGSAVARATALTNLGVAHLELGAHRLAERDLNGVLRLADQVGSANVAYAHAELGRVHFLRGDSKAALSSGRLALTELLRDVVVLDKEEVARVSWLFGGIFSASGQRNLALKYLNRAAAYFSQLGLRAEWRRCTDSIGLMLTGPARPNRSQLQEEVSRLDFLTAVFDLTDDLESVDPYLRGHSERVASLAVLIGEAMGLPDEELVTLNHAARLHDVGKIAVDAELLRREGGLTDAELRRVRIHPAVGEEMLRPYGLPREGLRAIRHHHEHFDGSGCPDGLAGEAIPLTARIIAVADTYDALTSDRVYRQAMSHSQAVSQLKQMAGIKLDPDLVAHFLDLHEI